MLPRHNDPIAAIATAPGRGSVGIVRISGRDIERLVKALLGKSLRPREATYLPFFDRDGLPIDRGLAIYFPGPNSFTGEDVLELHAHGGPVVLQLILARCLELAAQVDTKTDEPVLRGLRLAQPGEFTERAFLNDKIDLTQAEAIADLIDASTEAAARSATQSLSGVFSNKIHLLNDALIRLRMLVEATLDFPEEEIDFLEKSDANGQLLQLKDALNALRKETSQGALLRDGIRVVIAGQPNAGKSSLLNALAGAELAIVTPFAGTTRDKVQETIQIEGVPIHIIDTAGLRDSDDEVEQIGISRAWEAIEAADVIVFLHDLTRSLAPDYIAADAQIESILAQKVGKKVPILHVWNKADAITGGRPDVGIVLSAKTGTGLNLLRSALLDAAGWQAPTSGVFIARERHIQALRAVSSHLDEAADHLAMQAQSLDLLAEELRLAQNSLNEITGEFTSDDLLGVIFSKFCIGK